MEKARGGKIECMRNLFRTLSSSVLVGLATGLRSQMGLAAVVLRTNKEGLPSRLRTSAAARLVTVAAGAELVADKLPQVPDRLRPASLTGRLVLGGLAGGLLAHAEKGPVVPAAALGSAAALLAAKVGHDLRARAAQRVPDPVVAVAEDGVAVAMAVAGTRRTRSG
jgi:uncharacterized membrane protein